MRIFHSKKLTVVYFRVLARVDDRPDRCCSPELRSEWRNGVDHYVGYNLRKAPTRAVVGERRPDEVVINLQYRPTVRSVVERSVSEKKQTGREHASVKTPRAVFIDISRAFERELERVERWSGNHKGRALNWLFLVLKNSKFLPQALLNSHVRSLSLLGSEKRSDDIVVLR